jgi:hypothetical protein
VEETMNGIFGPWMSVNQTLMKRAIERGELPAHADIGLACTVIISMTTYRNQIERKISDKNFFANLFDNIILPALKSSK